MGVTIAKPDLALNANAHDSMASRTEELINEHQLRICSRTDRMFAKLLALEYVAGIVAALWISPLSWAGANSSLHIHVLAATVLGAIIVSFPIALVFWMPGAAVTRHTIAISQMLMSGLLIHLTGGRIETHFHIFGSLAFIGFYRDWRVLVSASVVVALDHFLRGVYWPESVFGTLSASKLRWVEHTAWVVFEDIFLIIAGFESLKQMREIAERQARLEYTNDVIERTVADRTRELVAAHDALEQTQEQLLQSQKLESVGHLAGGIAHDFNNILTGVLGYTGLLKRKFKTDEEVSQKLLVIEQSANRGRDLVSQLLGFARKGSYEKSDVQINQVVDETKRLLQASFNKNIEMKFSLDWHLPLVEGDPTQLTQVIMNLAVNARDAMPNGGEISFTTREVLIDEVFCRRMPDLVPGRYVKFTLKDTGTGIPEDVKNKIFDPFFTTKERGKGTGLGLSMVYGIARAHDGGVSVESVIGKGTSFHLYLPVKQVTSPVAELQAAKGADPTSEPIQTLAGKTILIVDDESVIRDFIGEDLRARGANLLFASNGQEAVKCYREHGSSIQLIVMDVIMPGMDGVIAYEEIKKINPQANVLFSSGYTENSDVLKLREDKRVGFIRKPFVGDDLSMKIQALLATETATAAVG